MEWRIETPQVTRPPNLQDELPAQVVRMPRVNPSNYEYHDPDGEKTKAQSEYIVTMRVKGSTLPAVEKKAKAAWGDKVRIEHVRRKTSNQDLLNDAQEHVEEAAEIVGELLSHMEERRDNTPENFQGTETYEMVEQAVDALESLKDEVEGFISSFDNVEFPGW